MKPSNVIVWFDLPTKDFDRACEFYSQILGNELRVDDSMGMKLGFFPMEGQMGVGGDLIPPSSDYEPAPANTGARVHFNVEGRLDDALSKVEPAGGKIVRPKVYMEKAGWMAMIEDTEGNQVGLYSTGKEEG